VLIVALAVACRSGTSGPSEPGSESSEAGAPFQLEEMTVETMQEAMAKGTLTSRGITELYLARIEALDRQGPMLKSVIETNPDALGIAEALDKERKEKGPRGPLHGIPVLIKDNIDTADRMMTTAGSLALVGPAPARDAFVVERSRSRLTAVLSLLLVLTQ
jgi:amidase